MKQTTLAVLFSVLAVSSVLATAPDLATIEELGIRYKFFVTIAPDGDTPARFMYADNDHIHVYHVKKDEVVEDWQTTLGTRASSLFTTDIEKDGETEIVIGTRNGRVLIYSAKNYDLLWENLQDRFESVEAMTSANIDRDPQDELIILAEGILYIYDGVSKAIEYQTIRQYEAQEIILGNVDDDPQLEIILNSGFIIDSQFFNVEYEADARFGDRIKLLDINNDGYPEIIGQTTDFTLRVFDVYAQRELW